MQLKFLGATTEEFEHVVVLWVRQTDSFFRKTGPVFVDNFPRLILSGQYHCDPGVDIEGAATYRSGIVNVAGCDNSSADCVCSEVFQFVAIVGENFVGVPFVFQCLCCVLACEWGPIVKLGVDARVKDVVEYAFVAGSNGVQTLLDCLL